MVAAAVTAVLALVALGLSAPPRPAAPPAAPVAALQACADRAVGSLAEEEIARLAEECRAARLDAARPDGTPGR